MKRGTGPKPGFGFDAPTVFLYDCETNREAQSAASARALGGEKGVENLSHVFQRDTHAVIGDRNSDESACGRELHGEGAMIARGRNSLFRIGDDIHEHFLQELPITLDRRQIFRRIEFQLDLASLQYRPFWLQY